MNKTMITVTMLGAMACSLHGTTLPRRATIIGGTIGGAGRCTVEVEVDGAAEVEVVGDSGRLRTMSGQTAVWRRFQCTSPMPRTPGDFRMVGLDGRGRVRLWQDPRHGGGIALVRIDDPKGGRDRYVFDLQWQGFGGGGGWQQPAPAPGHPGGGGGGFPVERAISICKDSVASRLNRDGYGQINFGRIVPDDNPGRNDWINGTVTGQNRFGTTRFSFACSVDFRSGTVRSVDVRRY